MLKSLLGLKLGQGQRFTPEGERLPVTLIATGPCVVVGRGEKSLQLGLGETKRASKPLSGYLKKAGISKIPLFLREVDLDEGEYKTGTEIKVLEIFKPGDTVNVTGFSKGRGFTGVVKRWGFKGGPRTHGQSDRERAPGSIGATTTPGRVLKGKRMAGKSGNAQVTMRNLKVFEVDPEKNVLILKGLVPGLKKGLLIIKKVS